MTFAWIVANFGAIVAAFTATVTAASAVAALTPTPRDDSALAYARRLIDVLALNVFNAKKP